MSKKTTIGKENVFETFKKLNLLRIYNYVVAKAKDCSIFCYFFYSINN